MKHGKKRGLDFTKSSYTQGSLRSQDQNGNTVLHRAALALNIDVVEHLLLQDPTLIRIKNNRGEKAIDLLYCDLFEDLNKFHEYTEKIFNTYFSSSQHDQPTFRQIERQKNLRRERKILEEEILIKFEQEKCVNEMLLNCEKTLYTAENKSSATNFTDEAGCKDFSLSRFNP